MWFSHEVLCQKSASVKTDVLHTKGEEQNFLKKPYKTSKTLGLKIAVLAWIYVKKLNIFNLNKFQALDFKTD